MVVGFNHNIVYKGDVFHVQTEDSGVSNPHIITLLYRGGTIISSRKTSYADIIKVDNLEKVVEELMKEQHKDMLRRLKSGEFDSRAFPGKDPQQVAPPVIPPATPAPRQPAASAPRQPAAIVAPPPPRPAPAKPAAPEQSLDEIILNYLIADDEHP